MLDLRQALSELLPHRCNIRKVTQTNDPTTGRLIESTSLVQSAAKCSLVAESAKDNRKGQSPSRERTFNLHIMTPYAITDKFIFTDFSGAGIPDPTARYAIDKESTVNPITNRLDGGGVYTGRTEIKHLKRIDLNE